MVTEEKKKPTEPWRSANIIDVAEEYKRPGFRRHWTRVDQIDKKLGEKWSFVVSKNPDGVAPEKTIIDGKALTGLVKRRELILMEMPEEMALSRDAYHKNLTDMSVKTKTQQFAKDTTIDGRQTSYGEIKITQGSSVKQTEGGK